MPGLPTSMLALTDKIALRPLRLRNTITQNGHMEHGTIAASVATARRYHLQLTVRKVRQVRKELIL
jgi:hypothetical protein